MAAYLIRRLWQFVPTLLGVVLLVFFLFNWIGGDPAYLLAGKIANPEQIENIRRQLGVDQPYYVQLWIFIKQIATGDFGASWATNEKVSAIFATRLGPSLTVLVPLLVEAGHDVVGLDADFFAPCTLPEQPLVEVPSLRRDLSDVEVGDLAGFGAVLHLGGLSNDPLGDLDASLTYEINDAASVRLARLAREAGVERFVFASSCSTYGAAGDDFLDETAAFNKVLAKLTGQARELIDREKRQRVK